jgi:hypothetical protein
MLWLENYCREHPTESFADAAFALVTDRLKALAAAGQRKGRTRKV